METMKCPPTPSQNLEAISAFLEKALNMESTAERTPSHYMVG
jgi:Ni,Fe-hydrogenase III small subunit